jgi:hypothetical protein
VIRCYRGAVSSANGKPRIDASVWWRFCKTALLWMIPALIVLPIYLVVVGISVLASEGALLEASEGVRGGINAALGPLLVLCGVAAAVVTGLWGADAESYLTGGFFAIVAIGLGVVLMTRALRQLGQS